MTPLGGSQKPQLFRVSFYTEKTSDYDLKKLQTKTEPAQT